MAIYHAIQWIHGNGAPSIRISIFSKSQATIRALSNVVNNSRIAAVSTFFLCSVIFRETAEPTSLLGLMHYFRNPPQLS